VKKANGISPLFPRATRDIPALGDLKPTGFWISWVYANSSGDGRLVGEGIERVCRALLHARPLVLPTFHSWNGRAPLSFSGFYVQSMTVNDPNGPDRHVVVTMQEDGRTIHDRLVWPPRFADIPNGVYPMYAVEVIGGHPSRQLEAVLAEIEERAAMRESA
jgi:hypothetical protein